MKEELEQATKATQKVKEETAKAIEVLSQMQESFESQNRKRKFTSNS